MRPPTRSDPGKAKARNLATRPLRRYSNFIDRATRTELRSFALLELLVFGVAAAISTNIAVIILVLVLIPNLAVQVRRLHDINVTGWALLLGLIPYVGALILLIMFCLPGTDGTNKFGDNPSA